MLFRVDMENSLRHAMERNELKLYYQPKLSLASDLVIGFEALVRWQHPRLGLIHPKEFLSLAEENGLIVPMGEWVIKTACMQCKDWQQKGLFNLSIAVNLSAKQLQRGDLVSQVSLALNQSNLHPSCLELELTESLKPYSDEAVAALTELAHIGVLIGVDDFGIGLPSFSLLKQMPISFIKIDQGFISGIPTDPNDIAITKAIIELGHSLNLKVIAEGVEDADQMQFLRGLHCDLAQGYFIGKPNSPEFFAENLIAKKFNFS